MPHDAALDPDLGDSDSELEFVEVDPTGRYGRVRTVIADTLHVLILLFFSLLYF